MDMKNAYEKSLRMIKEVKNKKEYIDIIDKENLLSVFTLEYISGKDFKDLMKEENNEENET